MVDAGALLMPWDPIGNKKNSNQGTSTNYD